MISNSTISGPSRIDTSLFARWWWTIDRVSLGILLSIIMIGMILVLAAGPGAATRLSIENSFHFPVRQLLFLGPAIGLMIGVSMLSPLQARRLGTIVFIGAFALLLATLAFAPEINGSKRWFYFGSFGLQSSEFLKPGFIVMAAWMLAEGTRKPEFPGAAIAAGIFAICIAALAFQPDYGQAALMTAIFGVMFFVAGASLLWVVGLIALGIGTVTGGYFFSDHIARRIDGFLSPESVDSYQNNKALQAIAEGGLVGRGGEGASIKHSLPDAHSDYIFAVAGEEFGLVFCLLIVLLFMAFVLRTYTKAAHLKSVFTQVAVCGLGAMIGLQSFINMAVSLRALPAKGMTLPFISYGGSSLLAMGLTAGLILAFTRRRGQAMRRREIMP